MRLFLKHGSSCAENKKDFCALWQRVLSSVVLQTTCSDFWAPFHWKGGVRALGSTLNGHRASLHLGLDCQGLFFLHLWLPGSTTAKIAVTFDSWWKRYTTSICWNRRWSPSTQPCLVLHCKLCLFFCIVIWKKRISMSFLSPSENFFFPSENFKK